jgi:hypothetical protein
MSAYLDSLKWDANGLVAVIAQVRDPGYKAAGNTVRRACNTSSTTLLCCRLQQPAYTSNCAAERGHRGGADAGLCRPRSSL